MSNNDISAGFSAKKGGRRMKKGQLKSEPGSPEPVFLKVSPWGTNLPLSSAKQEPPRARTQQRLRGEGGVGFFLGGHIFIFFRSFSAWGDQGIWKLLPYGVSSI